MAVSLSDSARAEQSWNPGSAVGEVQAWGDGEKATCTQELNRK